MFYPPQPVTYKVQPGFRGRVWHYRWDSRNQLRELETPDGKRWEYRYDSFGRRISKRHGDEEVRFLWDGDQPAEVRHYRQGDCISRRHWVHNGWELLVQQRQITPEQWETDFVTSDQNGAPQALYGNDGTVRWQAPKATLWGRRTVNDDSPDPGLAFAGQYRDSESGLCYNRFRYYDPDGGCYISPDPIGVAGGDNNYGYVPNPVGWVDPLGLAGCNSPNGYKTGDVDPHGSLSPNTNRASGHMNTKSDGFVQSHHPIQDAWAKKRINGYQRNSAPATLLRSASGSPHAKISAIQRARRAISGGWDTSLKQEFNTSYREMLDSGVPSAQAKKALSDAYKYFDGLRSSNLDNPFFNI